MGCKFLLLLVLATTLQGTAHAQTTRPPFTTAPPTTPTSRPTTPPPTTAVPPPASLCINRNILLYNGACLQLGTFAVRNSAFGQCLESEYEGNECPTATFNLARVCSFLFPYDVCNYGQPYSVYNGDCNCIQRKIQGRILDFDLIPLGTLCTVCQNPVGNVNGDPHFIGFNGHRFDFHGRNNTVYNLVSEPMVQVNALMGMMSNHPGKFKNMMWMTGFGISVGGNFSLEVALDLSAINTTVVHDRRADGEYRMLLPKHNFIDLKVNGKLAADKLYCGGTVDTGLDRVSLYFPPETAKHPSDETDGPLLVLSMPHMELTVYLETETSIHLDINVNITAPNLTSINGVLGQTYHWQPAVAHQLHGQEGDYIVQDGLLGVSYMHNLYTWEKQERHAWGVTPEMQHKARVLSTVAPRAAAWKLASSREMLEEGDNVWL